MSFDLYETIRRIVLDEMQSIRCAEIAVVQEIHPHADGGDTDNYSCTVQLRNSQTILKCVPVATSRIGSVSIPPVGSIVLVQFIGGDINAPVITGSFYSDQQRPPENDEGQSITHLPLGAQDSDAIHYEIHTKDKREFNCKIGNALTLTLLDDDPVVKIEVDGGKGMVQIDRDGTITLKSDAAVTIQGASELKCESDGDITIKSGGNVTLEAGGTMDIKGSTINLN